MCLHTFFSIIISYFLHHWKSSLVYFPLSLTCLLQLFFPETKLLDWKSLLKLIIACVCEDYIWTYLSLFWIYTYRYVSTFFCYCGIFDCVACFLSYTTYFSFLGFPLSPLKVPYSLSLSLSWPWCVYLYLYLMYFFVWIFILYYKGPLSYITHQHHRRHQQQHTLNWDYTPDSTLCWWR